MRRGQVGVRLGQRVPVAARLEQVDRLAQQGGTAVRLAGRGQQAQRHRPGPGTVSSGQPQLLLGPLPGGAGLPDPQVGQGQVGPPGDALLQAGVAFPEQPSAGLEVAQRREGPVGGEEVVTAGAQVLDAEHGAEHRFGHVLFEQFLGLVVGAHGGVRGDRRRQREADENPPALGTQGAERGERALRRGGHVPLEQGDLRPDAAEQGLPRRRPAFHGALEQRVAGLGGDRGPVRVGNREQRHRDQLQVEVVQLVALEGLGDGRRGVVGGLTADQRGHPGGQSAGTGVRLPATRVEAGHGGALAGERHAVEPLPDELHLRDDLGVGGRLRVDEGGDGLGGQFGVALPQQVPQDGGGVPHAQFAGERGLAQRLQMGGGRRRVGAPLRAGECHRQRVAFPLVGAVAQDQTEVVGAALHVVRRQCLFRGGAQDARAPARRDEVRESEVARHVDGGRAGTVQQLGDPAVQPGAGDGVHVLQHRGGGGRVPEDVTVQQARGVEGVDGFLGAGRRGAGQLPHGDGRREGAERGQCPGHPDMAGLAAVQQGQHRLAVGGAGDGRADLGGEVGAVVQQGVDEERAARGGPVVGVADVSGQGPAGLCGEQFADARLRQGSQAYAPVRLAEQLRVRGRAGLA